MPNRIIKESICTSETLAQLNDFDFRLWVGLITQADDYGRGEARPAIVRGRVFPLRDDVTLADVDASLRKMAEVGAITLYKVAGKMYYCFPTWGSHQNIRSKRSKYPSPDEADPEDDYVKDITLADNLQADASRCKQMQAYASICPRNPNPIQSESNPIRIQSESESNPNQKRNPNPNASGDTFAQYWAAIPHRADDPNDYANARAAWARVNPDAYKAAEILADVERKKRTDWVVEAPNAAVYLLTNWMTDYP